MTESEPVRDKPQEEHKNHPLKDSNKNAHLLLFKHATIINLLYTIRHLNTMHPIYGVWLLQLIYPYLGLHSNTRIHVLWMAATEIYEWVYNVDLGLTPLFMSNALATFLSFHAGWFLDRTSFHRLSQSLGVESTAMFHTINLCVHVYPVYHAWRRIRRPFRVLSWLRPEHAGVWTLYHHLSWALFRAKGINLSEIYIPMTNAQWAIMWGIAVIGHLLGSVVAYAYRHYGVIGSVATPISFHT